ncbi:helix-turn-helix domain-containing protein [Labrys okinawensis]|uniref:helix-turn-helix domain-containing protein n=1 Tax=Labrys okinawensis TaxID=346911 RepID=UPI0039BC6EE9
MVTLENLGLRVREKRGEQGIRAAAAEIGISHATLSRVERGFMPDLANYRRICRWLGIEVEAVTGVGASAAASEARVHFRKKPTVSAKTAQNLAQMILTAQAAMANLRQESD